MPLDRSHALTQLSELLSKLLEGGADGIRDLLPTRPWRTLAWWRLWNLGMWPHHRWWSSVPTVTIIPIATTGLTVPIGTITTIRIAPTARIGPILAGIPTATGGELAYPV
jgi:hypothetical protein